MDVSQEKTGGRTIRFLKSNDEKLLNRVTWELEEIVDVGDRENDGETLVQRYYTILDQHGRLE